VRGGNKGPSQSSSTAVWAVFDGLSKAALMDAVIDCARRHAGDELLDGPELVAAVRDLITPVLIARGDRFPNPRGDR
jgi:hypothetical protein